jgi:hypothetical protein
MFKITDENLINTMENFVEENFAQSEELIDVQIGCNPCSGSCGGSCSGGCAGSCRGDCTFSCSRYNR